MNLKPIKAAAQYAVGFAVAAGFVGLLTFIFSFLGTIFCAALTGMMLGATRCRIWKSFLCSLSFPGILLAVMRLAKSELPVPRLVLLSVLCLLAFWLTYPGAAALMALENKTKQRVGAGSVATVPPVQESRTSSTDEAARTVAPELTIEQLQGLWAWESGQSVSTTPSKTLEFAENRITLTVCGADGRVSRTATAQIRIEGRRSVSLVRPGPEHIEALDHCI